MSFDALKRLNTFASDTEDAQQKMARLYGEVQTQPKATASINPFLNKNGEVFNPYIDYQTVLDSPNIATKTKQFITDATGLMPTVTQTTSEQSAQRRTPESLYTLQHTGNTTPSTTGYTPTTTGYTPTTTTNTGNTIADAAQKYLGTPYVWGGESMDEGGMDCSGFVYNALRDAGYGVGRTTAQGYRSQGTVVSKDSMQPGDLIFFGKNNNASHIGIYLGNGQMIHSSGGSKNTKNNPGLGVSIINVDHRSDFIEARRY